MNAFTDEYTSRPDSKAEEANVNREKVIVILHYYRDADKAIKMNERVIKNLEDQYYGHATDHSNGGDVQQGPSNAHVAGHARSAR